MIAGIPVGTKYQVKESVTDGTIVNDMNVVYKASLDDDTFESPEYNETSAEAGIAIDKETRTITGEIPCSIINKSYIKETAEYKKVKVVITYTNQFGAISITKRVAGDVNEAQYYENTTGKEKEYSFTIRMYLMPLCILAHIRYIPIKTPLTKTMVLMLQQNQQQMGRLH